MYSLCFKLYTNYTQNPTLNPTRRASKTLHWGVSNPTFCFWTRMERMERIVRYVCNERNERNERDERKTGNGNRRWRASSLRLFLSLTLWLLDSLTLWLLDSLTLPFSFPPTRHFCKPPKKSNNFERIFSDSTLTFLTYRNTSRLPILPIRHIILLCLPLIKIWGRQIKIRGRQILTGCASKIPDFKGKVTKKGGSRGSSHISVQI